MWDYASVYGKALTYFARAEAHPVADDDEFAVWSLLGLEFLLRAPLAKINPCLLAEPDGDSMLAACGFPTKKDARSVGVGTVIKRLVHIVPGFEQHEGDAFFLMNLRNAELHSGDAALASLAASSWLPRLYRVAAVVCGHLGVSPDDVLGQDVSTQAASLVDAQDKTLQQEVGRRRNAAKAIFDALQPDEVEKRRQPPYSSPWRPDGLEVVSCTACGTSGPLQLRRVRRTNERIEDDMIFFDDIYVAETFTCSVCGLHLADTAEVAAAGLDQIYTRPQEESVSDRYISAYEGQEYGND